MFLFNTKFSSRSFDLYGRVLFLSTVFFCTTCSAESNNKMQLTQQPSPPTNTSNSKGIMDRSIGVLLDELPYKSISDPRYLTAQKTINLHGLHKTEQSLLELENPDPELLYLLAKREWLLGKADTASKHLTHALKKDLPLITGKWRNDIFWADIKDKPFGILIENTISTLGGKWRQAYKNKTPVLFWLPNTDSDDPYQRPPPTYLRAGIYNPTKKTFLPLGPSAEQAIFISVIPEREEVIVVSAQRYLGSNSSLSEVKIQSFDAFTAKAKSPQFSLAPQYEGAKAIEIIGDKNGVAFRAVISSESIPEIPPISQWQTITGKIPTKKPRSWSYLSAEGAIQLNDPGWEETSGITQFQFNIFKTQDHPGLNIQTKTGCTLGPNGKPVARLNYSLSGLEKNQTKTSVFHSGNGAASAILSHKENANDKLYLQLDTRLFVGPLQKNNMLEALTLWPKHLVLIPPLTSKFCAENY